MCVYSRGRLLKGYDILPKLGISRNKNNNYIFRRNLDFSTADHVDTLYEKRTDICIHVLQKKYIMASSCIHHVFSYYVLWERRLFGRGVYLRGVYLRVHLFEDAFI